MKQKESNVLIIILVVLVVLLALLVGTMILFVNKYFFIEGKPYPKNAEVLNLRGQEVSMEAYGAIREKLPDCRILWDVPFQNHTYPDDTTTLKVTALSEKDLDALAHFSALQEVDAAGCRDYEALGLLRERYPHLQVRYTVTIGGREYPQDAAAVTADQLTEEEIALLAYLPELKAVDATGCRDNSRLGILAGTYPHLDISYQVELLGQTFTEETVSATFRDPDVSVLMAQLASVSHLETVHLEEPSASPDQLMALMEAYPEISFSWNKTVLGKTFSSEDTEFDFSGMKLDGTDPVEEAMAYFPKAEKVIMSNCGIDNETMASFREKMRPDYKVVWTVYITKKPVRTDAVVIHSSGMGVCLIDEQSYDLKYCEDVVVLDIGHSYVKYIEWIEYMPNLEYLILAHNWIKDLTPISSCKKLIYLELFWNKHIPDYTPLLGCTALKDLNISGTYADPTPLQQMTWLENLWANMNDFSQREKQALVEALPNTRIEFNGGEYTGGGWRQVERYFEMRDIMGLPYNKW